MRAKNTITPLPWEEITTWTPTGLVPPPRPRWIYQVTREQLTPNFWRIVSTPLLVSDGSPPAAPFLAHRRYCLCELFSPCWRFTLATSTDGLLPLSFSVGGILAETKNFSSFFFGRSFWLFWCELFECGGYPSVHKKGWVELFVQTFFSFELEWKY